jgi:hypothetical protein
MALGAEVKFTDWSDLAEPAAPASDVGVCEQLLKLG